MKAKPKRVCAGLLAAWAIAGTAGNADAAANDAEALSPKAGLGRLLFFDRALSEPAGQSCASCHDPGRAFVDPDRNAVTSRGVIPPLVGSRNTPTPMYMAYSPRFHWDEKEGLYVGGQFWDGRAATLEEQARAPFVNPLEMANRTAVRWWKRCAAPPMRRSSKRCSARMR